MLKFLTLNIWGLPNLPLVDRTPCRKTRVEIICTALKEQAQKENGWDVVFIQEAWIPGDRKKIKNAGFQYSVDLDTKWNGALDSGLLILSKHPLESNHHKRLKFSHRGSQLRALIDGEILVNKSGIMSRMNHSQFGTVWLANTHLIAHYPGPHDVYAETRKKQLHQFIHWVKLHAGTDPFIVGGDFNFTHQCEHWHSLLEHFPDLVEPLESKSFIPKNPEAAHPTILSKLDHLIGSSHFHAHSGAARFEETHWIEGRANRVSDHFGWETCFELK